MIAIKKTLFLTILTALVSACLCAQVDAPPQDDYSFQGLQDNHPTRPGYRQTVTWQSASFYKYIVEKQTRGEPITTMEHMTIRLMIANRTWPVPPKLTDKDRAVAAWIDKHDTATANTIVLGSQAAGGKIDYDAAPPPSIEAFRNYYHGLPPTRRTTAAKLMLTFYSSSGFDMRSDDQRAAAAEREKPAGPSAAETAKADRDRQNAATAARDRDHFDAVHARDALIQRINESKQGYPADAIPPANTVTTPAQPAEPAAAPERGSSGTTDEPGAQPAQPAEAEAAPEAEPADTTDEPGAPPDTPATPAAPAEGKFDGVYRGSAEGTPMTLHISGSIISVTLEKVTLSGSVDANGNLSAAWSGITESIEVSGDEGQSGTINIQTQITLSGRVSGDRASGGLGIHSTGPGGFDESKSAGWSCSR